MTEIWAKSTGETLEEHTIHCLDTAKALINSLPYSDEKKQVLACEVLLALAFHDTGKAAIGFQKVLRGEQKDWGGLRHEILSAAFASSIRDIPDACIFAILTHHKTLPAEGTYAKKYECLPFEQIPFPNRQSEIWGQMAREWLDNRQLFDKTWQAICTAWGEAKLTSSELKLGKIELNPAWFSRSYSRWGQRKAISYTDRHHASLIRGLTIASDHLGSAHKLPPSIPNLKNFEILKCTPRWFQQKTQATVGNMILRAPTGSGKTEAALLWATHNQCTNGRLFYVLPYTASINAMYLRLGPGTCEDRRGIFGAENVGVLHARAISALYDMFDSETDETSKLARQAMARELSGLAREIWFPIRVCTPHQILRFMLRGKGWEIMLAEFPNSCFIYDEVHAYDPRIVGLILGCAKIVSSWGAKNLFLSATLPSFLKKLIGETLGEVSLIEPDVSEVSDREIADKKRHLLTIAQGTLESSLNEVIESIRSRNSTLIACNHVKTAQHIYFQLKRVFGSDAVLLHSRFNQEDRNYIESRLIDHGMLPKVLIATQVVEVSLNLDFEQAFSEPAPVDALVQRMGRVNRSGAREPAPVVVFRDQVHSGNLYCNCEGRKHMPNCRVLNSIEELGKIENPLSEQSLVEAADRVYGSGYTGEDKIKFHEGLNHPDLVNFEDHLLAGAHQEWVEQVVERLDNSVDVLPKCLVKRYEELKGQGLWVEANTLLVPVKTKSVAYLRNKLNTENDPWIINAPYSSPRDPLSNGLGLEL